MTAAIVSYLFGVFLIPVYAGYFSMNPVVAAWGTFTEEYYLKVVDPAHTVLLSLAGMFFGLSILTPVAAIREALHYYKEFSIVTLTMSKSKFKIDLPASSRFDPRLVTPGPKLGSGAFGTVFRGDLHVAVGGGSVTTPVAVKTVKSVLITQEQQRDVMVECATHMKLKHPHVVHYCRISDVGYELGNAGSDLRVELFGDWQCPDTKASYDSWFRSFAVRHASNVSVIFHPFPLPYHKNGFDSAQAAMVMIDALSSASSPPPPPPPPSSSSRRSAFLKVSDALFEAQPLFQTTATVNMTQRAVFENIFAPVAEKLGIDGPTFLGHMTNDDPLNSAARLAWKTGAQRGGVSGTPTFAANGAVADELATWSGAKWESWAQGK
eukprot:g1299.t1